MHGLLAVIAVTTLLACGRDTEPMREEAVTLSQVVLSRPELALIVGEVESLTAQAYDSRGRKTSASFEWSSADPAVASVGRTTGMITAISTGSTTVTATAGALSATAPVSVLPAGPFRLSISSSALSLLVGSLERLTAVAYDAKGRTMSASAEWSAADPTIASVGKSDGVVTAISAGITTVTAAVGNLRATGTVSVTDLAGAIAFTRVTGWGSASPTFDVLSFSAADPTARSLPRRAEFASIAAPAWSPDGTLLAVEVVHTAVMLPGGEDGIDYTSDLYVLRAAAPAESPWRALTANDRSRSPSWSPDGRRIAYIGPSTLPNRNHIYVVDAGGGEPIRLTRSDGLYAGPRWSPDGARLAFSDGLVGNGDIFLVNADGSGLTNVTRSAAFEADPSWSPDGARLAFISDRDTSEGTYRRDLFVVDVDGTNLRRLTNDGGNVWASGPVWSPDGRQILFSLGTRENPRIYVMNADGSGRFRLTTPPANAFDSAPAWKR